jgi:hypothetical protein
VVAVIFFVRFCFLSIFVRFAGNFVRSNVSSATKKTGRKCTHHTHGGGIEQKQIAAMRRVHFLQIEFGVGGKEKSNENRTKKIPPQPR